MMTTLRERAVTVMWTLVLLACCAVLIVWRSVADEHPAARVQRGTLAADLVASAGPAAVERPYEKRAGDKDVCDGDPDVVTVLETMHPRSESLRGRLQRPRARALVPHFGVR